MSTISVAYTGSPNLLNDGVPFLPQTPNLSLHWWPPRKRECSDVTFQSGPWCKANHGTPLLLGPHIQERETMLFLFEYGKWVRLSRARFAENRGLCRSRGEGQKGLPWSIRAYMEWNHVHTYTGLHCPPLPADLGTPCCIPERGLGKTRVRSLQLLVICFLLLVESQTPNLPGFSCVCLHGLWCRPDGCFEFISPLEEESKGAGRGLGQKWCWQKAVKFKPPKWNPLSLLASLKLI